MKIFILHNRYRFRGGEDECVDNDIQTLTDSGYCIVSKVLPPLNFAESCVSAALSSFGGKWENQLRAWLELERPDILHVHNMLPRFSARIFPMAKSMNIRTVLTLHNYRPYCLNGLFLTPNNQVCESCVNGDYRPGIRKGCYKRSRIGSAVLAHQMHTAKARNWYESVDVAIAPSKFLRQKFISLGWSEKRIRYLTNISREPVSDQTTVPSDYVLYLGRLSKEKGVLWLAETYKNSRCLEGQNLIIAGTGPLESQLRQMDHPLIKCVGYVEGESKKALIRSAKALVMPSECYENAPTAIVEAQANGVPVIVPNHGGLAEWVIPGESGERYSPEDPIDYCEALRRIDKGTAEDKLREKTLQFAKHFYSQNESIKSRGQLYGELMEMINSTGK